MYSPVCVNGFALTRQIYVCAIVEGGPENLAPRANEAYLVNEVFFVHVLLAPRTKLTIVRVLLSQLLKREDAVLADKYLGAV